MSDNCELIRFWPGDLHNAPQVERLIGFFFYLATLVALILTRNPVLFPTVVLVGSFMIPVAYVAFFYDRRQQSRLTVPMIARSFIYGGLFGVLAASLLEPLFIRRLDIVTAFVVGLIESSSKFWGYCSSPGTCVTMLKWMVSCLA